jgi:hypothetical protein
MPQARAEAAAEREALLGALLAHLQSAPPERFRFDARGAFLKPAIMCIESSAADTAAGRRFYIHVRDGQFLFCMPKTRKYIDARGGGELVRAMNAYFEELAAEQLQQQQAAAPPRRGSLLLLGALRFSSSFSLGRAAAPAVDATAPVTTV